MENLSVLGITAVDEGPPEAEIEEWSHIPEETCFCNALTHMQSHLPLEHLFTISNAE